MYILLLFLHPHYQSNYQFQEEQKESATHKDCFCEKTFHANNSDASFVSLVVVVSLIAAAPSRTVPPVNVNFGNDSMHQETIMPLTGQTSPMTAHKPGHEPADSQISDPKKTVDVTLTSTVTPDITTEGVQQKSSTSEAPEVVEIKGESEESVEKPKDKIPEEDHADPESSTSVKSEEVHPSFSTEDTLSDQPETTSVSSSTSSQAPVTEGKTLINDLRKDVLMSERIKFTYPVSIRDLTHV